MRRFKRRRIALSCVFVALLFSGSAYAAFQQLPPGDQVNNDPGAGIDPNRAVNLDDPTNADVVGGALTAGGPAVPWAIFRQTTSGKDQVFVRSFAKGAWKTRGHGTVNGKSSGSPTFSGSLNFDQGQDGEAPAIDFAGAGRTVPWATWYEDTQAFGGAKNIFASRFDQAQDKWIFAGQSRGTGTGTTAVPSLNIHTGKDAENPSVAGGSAVDPTKPGPWITWQEKGANAPGTGRDQIFVEKPIGPGAANCNGVKPAGVNPGAAPLGGFCWQQVGVERLGADPSLNVDRQRDGIEPDIAFTGKNDKVPWVVWYEQGNGDPTLHHNEMVFAAKAVAPAGPTGTVDGGFNWISVGNTGSGVLDASANGGPCAANSDAEAGCSLNKDAGADAEDPRVATGTMNPAGDTVPWVIWDEGNAVNPQNNKVFVSRLVNGHFKIANGGQPIATGSRPDITFSGNTPYVSWHNGGKALYGHFVTPDQFVVDNGPVGTNVSDEVRAPISSSCIATPFNADGAACQGGTLGTPFFLFSDGDAAHAKLFANAYQTDAPITGAPTGVTDTSGTLNGSVNPQGTAVRVQFQYGPTTAYGQTTAAQKVGPANSAVAFSAALGGLSQNTTIHYRAIASTDFGTVAGADQILRTSGPDHTAPKLKVKVGKVGLAALVSRGKLKVRVSVDEPARVRISASLKARIKHHKRTVTIGKSATIRFRSAGSKVVTVKLTRRGKALLRHAQKARITLAARATDLAGNSHTKRISATFRR